jgi:glycosyltransferase involved in cell wall biosynthesis
MKKIKLLHIGRIIRPGGGPSGYLYNLSAISKERKSEWVKTFAFKYSDERSALNSSKSGVIILSLPYFLRKNYVKSLLVVRNIIDIYRAIQLRFNIGDAFPVFHDQMLAYWYGKLFSRPYCVMPHQPIEIAREIDDAYRYRYNLNANDIYGLVVTKEILAYINASIIICPTSYSLDGYFISKNEYKSVLNSTPKHMVPSTVTLPNSVLGRLKTRELLSIEENKLAIGFIGRYNSDKGYDRFLSIAKRHRNKPNLIFFSAGAGEMQSNEAGVTDLGWRKDIADIITAMDLIIIPNRVTYFDLLPIESLMLGTPVAVTSAGGNKWLLDQVEDNSVLELKLNEVCSSDNLDAIIDIMPSRVQFKSSRLAEHFNNKNFIDSHENLTYKLNVLG